MATVNPPRGSDRTRTLVSKGDLLVVITGAGVTNPAMLEQDLGEAYVSQHVALIKPALTELSPWLLLWLMAPAGARRKLVERAYGAGKPGLNLDNLRSLSVLIPPVDEQRAILAKVKVMATLCDDVEMQLADLDRQRTRLLQVTLHKALDVA